MGLGGRNQEVIESLAKTPPWFFGYDINVQETIRIVACGFVVHFVKLTSGNGVGTSTVNLIQLSLVTGLENQILCCIKMNGARNTDPALDQEINC